MKTRTQVRFVDKDKSKSQFFMTLRKRVDNYFEENNLSKKYNKTMVLKTIILLSAYAIPFLTIIIFQPSFYVNIALWSLMGFALAGIGMSIMHDANHGAYSSNEKINYWLGLTLNLLGGAVFNWKIQHNILHHTYTNIVNMDDDIDDKLILRFSPHTRVKWYQKFQVVYAFLFYGILTLYWVVAKDFVQFYQYSKGGLIKGDNAQKRITFMKIIAHKLVYVFLFFVLPILILKLNVLQFFAGYFLMHFIAGIVLTVIFQLAHTVEDTSHPLPNENNIIENDWAIHQMNTTVDFARGNKFITWYVGGLNFQVEHHLFPTICHVHYPEISKIVEATAKEFNVPFLENKTFGTALKSHIRTLQRFGKMPNLNEAIG